MILVQRKFIQYEISDLSISFFICTPSIIYFMFPLCMNIIFFVLLHDSTFSHILVCMIAFQHQDQNVYRIPSVLITSHASRKNARIRVLLTPVDRMPNARLKTIEHCVFVSMVMQEILTLFVKNVRLRSYFTYHSEKSIK